MSKVYNTYESSINRIINKDGVDCILIVQGKETTPLLTKIKRLFKKPTKKFMMIDTKELEKAVKSEIKYSYEDKAIWE